MYAIRSAALLSCCVLLGCGSGEPPGLVLDAAAPPRPVDAAAAIDDASSCPEALPGAQCYCTAVAGSDAAIFMIGLGCEAPSRRVGGGCSSVSGMITAYTSSLNQACGLASSGPSYMCVWLSCGP